MFEIVLFIILNCYHLKLGSLYYGINHKLIKFYKFKLLFKIKMHLVLENLTNILSEHNFENKFQYIYKIKK
jgi:hypothetical protein